MPTRAATIVVLTCSVALGLAACQRREQPAPPASGAPAATTAAPAPARPAPKGPTRAAGLWEMSISTADTDFVQTTQVCIDAAADQDLAIWDTGSSRSRCSQSQVTPRPGGGWTFAATCDMGSGGTVTTAGEAIGDFSRDYTVALESARQGAEVAHMNRTTRMTIKARRIGACAPGQKGGDTTVPGA
jgi:hypothetical protein